ncbi:angio-associated migratory cell protein [Hyalella azteca]|uniref:Angio-associated migratory cell protein n=1 Tax=Hyalella azteca TaxID=294128 RepID=A0A8B7NFE3_HYAAZ|nr:angio-associated migratory cell protein [Hyalella azteca]
MDANSSLPADLSNHNSDEDDSILNPDEFEVLDIDDNHQESIVDQDDDNAEVGMDDDADEEPDFLPIAEDDCETIESSLLFEKNEDSVLCCCVSQCGSLIATGGLDNSGYVLNSYTGNVLFKCTGHSESVEFAYVSHDSELVATGDLDGLVQVWRVRNGESCFSFHTGSEMRWLEWHKNSHILFCGTESGEVWVWLVPKGITKTLANPGTSVESGSCTPDGKRAVVGYSNGSVRVLDIKSEAAVKLDPLSSFSDAVIAVACHPDNVIAIAGSQDGDVKIFNTNTGKAIHNLSVEQFNSGEKQSIEAVGFCSSVPHLAMFADVRGTIVIYDTNNQVARHVIRVPAGVTRFCFPSSSSSVFVGCTDGVIRHYDALTGKLLAKLVGHSSEVMSLSLDGSGSILASSSNDKVVRIYNVSSCSKS